MDLELGRFELLLGQTGFGRGRRFRPPPCYMHQPGRSATTRRSRRPSFTANYRRISPDRAGERGCGCHGGSPDFPIFRPFQADPYLLPPIFGPLNSFQWSLFEDSSPFERYDENKFGRLLDRVFRPLQQPLDQGKGTVVFLVSWALR